MLSEITSAHLVEGIAEFMESLLNAFPDDKQAIVFPAFRQVNKALSRFFRPATNSGTAEDMEVVYSNLVALTGLVKNKSICEALFQFNGMSFRWILIPIRCLLIFRLHCSATAESCFLPKCTRDQLLQIQDYWPDLF